VQRTPTHLLCYHDNESSQRCAPDASDGKKLLEPGKVSPSTGEMLFPVQDRDVAITKHDFFQPYLRMDIVEISSGLKRCVPKAAK